MSSSLSSSDSDSIGSTHSPIHQQQQQQTTNCESSSGNTIHNAQQPTATSRKSSSRQVAGYELQHKLGSGSFASVYYATRVPINNLNSEEHLPDNAAVKVIRRDDRFLKNKKVLESLESEIAILRTVHHENIVSLYEVVQRSKESKHIYLVLEYCAGGDLQHLIRSRKLGRLSEFLSRRLMRDLTEGLRFLWMNSLIHRDIKPQNLLLTGLLPLDELLDPAKTEELEQERVQANFPSHKFRLKIADFGFARQLQTTALAETLCGSPLYMAPEILQHQRYDAKADLWSTGTVLFEMLTGRPPFNGENHIDLLRNIQRKAVRLPIDVKVSGECVSLLRLLLHRHPHRRGSFEQFFSASNAFVALGCNGDPIQDSSRNSGGITMEMVRKDLHSIEEHMDEHTSSEQQQQQQDSSMHYITPDSAPRVMTTTLSQKCENENSRVSAAFNRMRQQQYPSFTPLIPSPSFRPMRPPPKSSLNNTSDLVPPLFSLNDNIDPVQVDATNKLNQASGNKSSASSSEEEFVMIERPALTCYNNSQQAAGVGYRWNEPPLHPYNRCRVTPKSIQNPIQSTKTKQLSSATGGTDNSNSFPKNKGMLGTSPQTGGALIAMMSNRGNGKPSSITPPVHHQHQPSQTFSRIGAKGIAQPGGLDIAAKMLAAAEDVGRRAVNVAHVGDTRSYTAMHLMMEYSTSGSVSMEVVGEHNNNETNTAFTPTDDPPFACEISNEISLRENNNNTAIYTVDMDLDEEEEDDMPFAMPSEVSDRSADDSINPSNVGHSSASSNQQMDSTSKNLVNDSKILFLGKYAISAHFKESLSCYMKALSLMKCAIGAVQRVVEVLNMATSSSENANMLRDNHELFNRCQLSLKWLGRQYKALLERADAANSELAKVHVGDAYTESLNGANVISPLSCEELIYNHALACGKEGAVKQLLGQHESARSCYKSAGLLMEALLMEPQLGANDQTLLKEYVRRFADQIRDVDKLSSSSSRRSSLGSLAAI